MKKNESVQKAFVNLYDYLGGQGMDEAVNDLILIERELNILMDKCHINEKAKKD